jgi:hypothetical protein
VEGYVAHTFPVRAKINLWPQSEIEYRIEKEFTGANKLVKTGKKKRARTDLSVQQEFDEIMKKLAAADAKHRAAHEAAEDHLFDRPHGPGLFRHSLSSCTVFSYT